MAQQIAQTLDDGKPEAEAAAAFARGVVELMVFLEDRLQVRRRGCRCRCPRPRCSAFPRRRRQPSSTLPRLVYFSAFESRLRIICSSRRGSLSIERPHGTTRRARLLRLRVVGELVPQPVKQIVDRETDHFGVNGARFDLVDVEQRVQHARHGAQASRRAARPAPLRLLALDDPWPAAPAAGQASAAAGGGHGSRQRESATWRRWPVGPAAWPPSNASAVCRRSVMSAKVMTTPSTPSSWVR